MTKNEARQLHEYTRWANARLIGALEALPASQTAASAPSSFPSPGATLAHIVGTEWIWLRRWLGESPPMPSWVAEWSLPDLKARLAEVETARRAYLEELPETGLEQVLNYRSLAGAPFANRLSDLLRHMVNHSTYHRGQAATQLRQLGHTPASTDFITFLRETQ